MTRDDQVRAIATDLKIRVRIFALKRLALESRRRVRGRRCRFDRELRALIDDDRPNSTQ
jgi:hypothetical protein